VDGTSNGRGAEFGIVLTTLEGSIIEQSYSLKFHATSIDAEYKAVIAGLTMAVTFGIAVLEIRWTHYS